MNAKKFFYVVLCALGIIITTAPLTFAGEEQNTPRLVVHGLFEQLVDNHLADTPVMIDNIGFGIEPTKKYTLVAGVTNKKAKIVKVVRRFTWSKYEDNHPKVAFRENTYSLAHIPNCCKRIFTFWGGNGNPEDRGKFEMYVVDEQGNVSNTVTLEPVYIRNATPPPTVPVKQN